MASRIFVILAVIAAAATIVAGQRYNARPPPPPYPVPVQPAVPKDPQTLQFRVSARNLPDKDKVFTIDPYVTIHAVDGDAKKEYNVGRTQTLSNTRNPDFPNVFNIKFDRTKNQRLHIRVWDNDSFRRDDKAGETWVSLNQYVDGGQRIESNLNKKGYVILQKA